MLIHYLYSKKRALLKNGASPRGVVEKILRHIVIRKTYVKTRDCKEKVLSFVKGNGEMKKSNFRTDLRSAGAEITQILYGILYILLRRFSEREVCAF